MIKGLTAGTGINVVNGSTYVPSYSMSNAYAGTMRYNTSNQCLEVFDGNGSWQVMSMAWPTVELNMSTQEAIVWCQKKMAEEKQLEALAAKHPGVKDLKEKLDLMVKLVGSENDRAVESA